jgi:hypothetical protein
MPAQSPVAPTRVRYIKLGEGGRWERECLQKGVIRFGLDGYEAERFLLCRAGQWDPLRQSFLERGRSQGTATRFTNETQLLFEDDGSVLWITFVGEQLCWGQLTPQPPELHADGTGVWRRVAGGWKKTDAHGEPLRKTGCRERSRSWPPTVAPPVTWT